MTTLIIQRSRLTPEIAIDSRSNFTTVDVNVFHDDGPCALRLAIPTAPIQLPNLLSEEVLDMNRSAPVVLEHLVTRLPRAAAVHVRGARLLLESGRIFAHFGPPHVIERTRAHAVHALAVVRPNDDIGQRSAVLDDEDGVFVASLILALAGRRAAIVHLHAAVEAASHLLRRVQVHIAVWLREGRLQWRADSAAAARTHVRRWLGGDFGCVWRGRYCCWICTCISGS